MATKKMTKRAQIDKAKAQLLLIIGVAAFVAIGCLVVAKGYFSQANYLGKIAGQKEKAVQQLKINKSAVSSLTEAYKKFATQNPNLLGGSVSGNGERDGDNGRLVLDALPSSYDFPALTSSIEKLLTGYKINSITGSDDSAAQSQTEATEAVEMPFSVSLSTNYASFQELMKNFDRSIRPFQVTTLQLSGTNDTLQVDMAARTFYLPSGGLKIEQKEVK
jgi:hypothetical protein